jgi:Bacterial regulatory proteins, tetR family
MRRPSLKNLKFSNEGISKARGGGLREAIISAAQRPFLERGFGSVSMDDLTAAAGVRCTNNSQARRRSFGRSSSGCRLSSRPHFPPRIKLKPTSRTRCA